MATKDIVVTDVDAAVWQEAEAYTRSHQTSLGALVTKALRWYLEDLADVELAQASAAEGGRVPYDLVASLLLAEGDEAVNEARVRIDEILAAQSESAER